MRDFKNDKYISREELYQILNRVGRDSDAASPQFAIIPLLISYGIYGEKGSEILNLKWQDINFNIATITINEPGAERVIDIGDRMLNVLQAALKSSSYIDTSNQKRTLHQVSDYVLKSFVKDERVNYWQLRKRFNLIFKTANIDVTTKDIMNWYFILKLKREYNKKHKLNYNDFADVQIANGIEVTPYKVYNLINIFEEAYNIKVISHERNRKESLQ